MKVGLEVGVGGKGTEINFDTVSNIRNLYVAILVNLTCFRALWLRWEKLC